VALQNEPARQLKHALASVAPAEGLNVPLPHAVGVMLPAAHQLPAGLQYKREK
jgi:hypothetical protein